MEQHFSLTEFLQLALYLGSVTFVLGLTYQLFISIKADQKINFKQWILVVLTRFLTVAFTIFIWRYWQMSVDILFGPILLPAFMAELLLSPLLLKLFGYHIWLTKNNI
jgi:hypothetical protein